jgi:uncharacterized damage-inducible protein DinB
MATKRGSAAKAKKSGAKGKKSAAKKSSTTTAKRPSISATLLPEFDQEMATTRRVLERVPSEKGTWKPHAKSFSLAHLAQLVSWMPGWITNALHETELNLAGAGRYSNETTESLLEMFDDNVKAARAAIAKSKDSDYDVDWSLKYGDRVIFTQPRAAVIRQNINHLVHHRGQLSVYLRLIDVPVPSIYGPTADERVPGF